MNKKIKIFDVDVDLLNMNETISKITKAVETHQQIEHVGINSSKVVQIKSDPALRAIVQHSDMVNVDGYSMVKAIKWVGGEDVQRVTGIDTMIQLLKVAEKRGFSVYFLGAKESVIQKMIKKVEHDYPDLKIAGYRNGYFSVGDEEEIIASINSSQADLLFVGITSPFKEFFINRHKSELSPSLLMGVGGSFDVISGEISRAPKFMQHHGLEWLYRLSREPGRLFKRYTMDNLKFFKLLILEQKKHKIGKGMYREEKN